MWVKSRQYTGRLVTVTNDKIFETPVYNYTREFPFIWEEIMIPVSYSSNDEAAEKILLRATEKHSVQVAELTGTALKQMEEIYGVKLIDVNPRVFYRLTDNWIELTVRFLVPTHGIREVKDAISREIRRELNKMGIGVASSTYDIVGFPPIMLRRDRSLTTKSRPPDRSSEIRETPKS